MWSTEQLMSLDIQAAGAVITDLWSAEIEPELHDYIAIPALSPAFDDEWAANGHLATAVEHIRAWMAARPIEGMTVEVHELDGRTPVILAEIPAHGVDAAAAPTVLLYGHLDKQPEMEGWRADLGPWTPVREGDRLYGRGGADDGYAAYASLAAIEAVRRSGGAHGRCLVLIEASEESGSPDLPAHVDALRSRLGDVDLIVCLDSGCGDYSTMWVTTSLRGLVGGTLSIEILTEGVHSGSASGVVPSSFRIMRLLLDRIEDAATGAVLVSSANVEIPDHRRGEVEAMVSALGAGRAAEFPMVAGSEPAILDAVEAELARTWKPTVSYTGIDGLPSTAMAGNVLRPGTAVKLSLRLPPTAEPDQVRDELTAVLEADPPYGATVTFDGNEVGPGWNAPELAPWLRTALDAASTEAFGAPAQLMGEGGSIPFMGMLGAEFPEAQFVITGVLGPGSNAHGPNEFLDVAYAEKLTRAIAVVLDHHGRR
ncbi:MAG: M20/M25/M40 family metallo-hydrolase [Actinomycetota bacterium]